MLLGWLILSGSVVYPNSDKFFLKGMFLHDEHLRKNSSVFRVVYTICSSGFWVVIYDLQFRVLGCMEAIKQFVYNDLQFRVLSRAQRRCLPPRRAAEKVLKKFLHRKEQGHRSFAHSRWHGYAISNFYEGTNLMVLLF